MYLDEKKVQESQIREDIQDVYKLYDLDTLDTCDEISEGLEAMGALAKQFRHIHVEIKHLTGETVHITEFPHFDKISQHALDFQLQAKNKFRDLKKLIQANEENKNKESLKIFYRKSTHDGVSIILSTLNPELVSNITSVFITLSDGRITSVRSSGKKNSRYKNK